jgi:hypothetical protein
MASEAQPATQSEIPPNEPARRTWWAGPYRTFAVASPADAPEPKFPQPLTPGGFEFSARMERIRDSFEQPPIPRRYSVDLLRQLLGAVDMGWGTVEVAVGADGLLRVVSDPSTVGFLAPVTEA